MEQALILTDAQREAIKQGQAVRVTDSQSHLECVPVRSDVYDRLRAPLFDDGPLSPEEKLAAIRAAGLRANWDDSALDVYEQYRRDS